MNKRLPHPHLTKIYRLEATLGEPQVLGETSGGRRRIVPLTGGTFSGPELRGEDVDANEYTFRASTKIETAAAELDWVNKNIFISVAAGQPGGVTYEVYLVA